MEHVVHVCPFGIPARPCANIHDGKQGVERVRKIHPLAKLGIHGQSAESSSAAERKGRKRTSRFRRRKRRARYFGYAWGLFFWSKWWAKYRGNCGGGSTIVECDGAVGL